ncbi:MAG: methylmalonyl Co-A mutase-associated GTPase MeaB [Flavobacteriales bacterium]|nr:methylmalonyl Co-A mutase-associated GTPase MeaB [Flavobacteriales bacterium]MCB9174249.1 methylmalonyl Co-A mutase-associated GTPase MeaB [Flavobacteriales bacterium]
MALNDFSQKKKQFFNVDYYFEGIRNKNLTILSKAITLLESTKTEHQQLAEELIELCLPLSGKSIRIGITGVPGVGKSTFIESFGKYVIETHNKKVAVLAIDPSSTKSKGSILGDKTRMNFLSTNEHAFVRPSPSSGTLGGVAKATRESIILCEAFGFDTIIIETVGVGQSETEVHSMVDFFLLLMLAGAGDELQGIKRGIMEMADTIVINKTDIEDKDRVKLAQQHYKNALHLFPANENGWIPKVETCSGLNNSGIAKVWKIITEYQQKTYDNGWFDNKRKQQAIFWLTETINNSILTLFYNKPSIKELLQKMEQDVINGKTSPFKAAKILLEKYK